MNLGKPKRQRGVILTYKGWQRLQDARRQSEIQENYGDKYTLEALSERTGLDPDTVAKALGCQEAVDKLTLHRLFRAFNLGLEETDYSRPSPNLEHRKQVIVNTRRDWGEAVDVSVFYGRTEELTQLEQWVLLDGCRLVALLGMGGIGKTCLAVKLAEQVKEEFEYIAWRSLRNAPPVKDILANLIQFLSDEQETDLPENVGDRVSRLIKYLGSSRCLLVLDNADAILQGGERAGYYREGYEGYGELLHRVGEARHQSCLMLTSREKPKELALLEGEVLPVRSLHLSGLKPQEGQQILRTKGLRVSESESRLLVERYCGNPLALKIVATTIKDTLDGRISEFLNQKAAVFGDIRDLLAAQFNRLSDLEKEIVYWLTLNREPVSLSELQEDIVSPVPQIRLLEALESLRRRSLIEKNAALFSLQPVVMEYLTECFIQQVCQEIARKKIALFRSHALLKAQAKDYIKDTQVHLILKPVIDGLLTVFRNKRSIENQLTQMLSMLRENSPLEPGYTGGNILNLLCCLQTDLSGYDFSNLMVWQADLRSVNLHHVNFANADLAKSVFAEKFGSILSVAFSPSGKFLATGDVDGKTCLWQLAGGKQLFIFEGLGWVRSVAFSPDGSILSSGSSDPTVRCWDVKTGQCFQTLQGHTHLIRSVAFHPDGQILVSASEDQTVKLWNVGTGQCLKTLQEHAGAVSSATFSPQGNILASSSEDQTVKLWDVSDGKCLKTLRGHTHRVRSVTFSADSQTLASSSDDQSIKIWDVHTGNCLKTLWGHSHWVRSVTFSPDGQMLASSSEDKTVRLWDVSTGQCHKVLQGHSSGIWSIAFSRDDQTLASSSEDKTIRLWDVSTGQCYKTLQGYSNRVLSVTFSSDGQVLASGNGDQTVKLWDVSTGQCRKTLRGHTHLVRTINFSPDGRTLASGSEDQTVRLWDVDTGQCLKTLQGHTDWVWCVAFSPDGQILASSGDDQTIRLWDIGTGQYCKVLQEHTNWVWSIAFSPDGQMLVSGSEDQTIRLWDINTGQYLRVLQGHDRGVWAVAFSPDGQTLASGSVDRTVRLWDVRTGHCLKVLQGHTEPLISVRFSPNGQMLASGSVDRTVRLWDVRTGHCLRLLQEHTHRVRSVAFSPNGQTLASSSEDETIKLWDIQTGQCLRTLRSKRPYEHMNITGATNLTEATIATLKALGAVEFHGTVPKSLELS